GVPRTGLAWGPDRGQAQFGGGGEGGAAGSIEMAPLRGPAPRPRRRHSRVLRGEVEGEGAAAAEPCHAEAVRLRPWLLLRVVGGGADVAQKLGARYLARDLAHLLEVLPLHAAFALVELGSDGVEAGMGKAAHDVLVLVVVAREAGDHHDDG